MANTSRKLARATGKAELQRARQRIRELEAQVSPTDPKTHELVPGVVPVLDPRPLKLDLACGQVVADGYRGVDKFADVEFKVDLCSGERWPWEDSSVDALRCSHFIEHIPMTDVETGQLTTAPNGLGGSMTVKVRIDALVRFFNEAFRVAKPGAVFELWWPALQNVRAFMDPTHRRFIPLETMFYLSKQWRTENKLDHYLGATCDWVLTSGAPTILQKDALLSDVVQAQKFREAWNFAQDHTAVLRANK